MKRIHPFLAVALVALAVVLVTLAMSVRCETVPVGPRARPFDVDAIPYINGHAIYPGSENCAPRTDRRYVPSAERVRAIRYFTVRTIELDLDTKALTTPLAYDVWRKVIEIARETEPRFVDRPIWGQYATPPGYQPNCGIYFCACAAGVGTWPPQIDTSDPARVEPLVTWELTNALLGQLQRPDLWDTSSYVGSVNRRVEQWLGGWKQE